VNDWLEQRTESRPPIQAPRITETPEQQLEMLRRAWRSRLSAEATLERLRRFSRHTSGMKHDFNRAAAALREADSVLVRLLG